MPKLRHVALFRWKPDVTPEMIATAGAALDRLAAVVPTLRAYHHGPDLGINPVAFDYAVVGEFDDVDGYVTYRDHPDHQAFVATFVAVHVAERASLQYELRDPGSS